MATPKRVVEPPKQRTADEEYAAEHPEVAKEISSAQTGPSASVKAPVSSQPPPNVTPSDAVPAQENPTFQLPEAKTIRTSESFSGPQVVEILGKEQQAADRKVLESRVSLAQKNLEAYDAARLKQETEQDNIISRADDTIQRIEREKSDRQKALDAKEKELAQLEAEARKPIDPTRIFAKQSTWDVILDTIGAMAAGFAGTDALRLYMERRNKAIEQDIDAQKSLRAAYAQSGQKALEGIKLSTELLNKSDDEKRYYYLLREKTAAEQALSRTNNAVARAQLTNLISEDQKAIVEYGIKIHQVAGSSSSSSFAIQDPMASPLVKAENENLKKATDYGTATYVFPTEKDRREFESKAQSQVDLEESANQMMQILQEAGRTAMVPNTTTGAKYDAARKRLIAGITQGQNNGSLARATDNDIKFSEAESGVTGFWSLQSVAARIGALQRLVDAGRKHLQQDIDRSGASIGKRVNYKVKGGSLPAVKTSSFTGSAPEDVTPTAQASDLAERQMNERE